MGIGARKPAIVLAHGIVHPLGAATDVILKRTYFRTVPEFLRKRGYRVLEPKVANMGHVSERAEQLREKIAAWDERDPGERVCLISHSMGGLDARHMIASLGGDELVETLVTVGTPHMGCCVADFVLDEVPLMSDVAERLEKVGLSLRALSCLAQRNAQAFNQNCPDSQKVRYFSISGQKGQDERQYSPILRPTLKYVGQREGPNDGMVSVKSSIWGKHLGVLPFDHIEQIDETSIYDRILKLTMPEQEPSPAEVRSIPLSVSMYVPAERAVGGDWAMSG